MQSGARSIHIAARKGHVPVIQTLLLKGEQVDATTNDNYTALHVAVQAGKANVVETLLGYGAQVHIRAGPMEETPLHIASRVPDGGEKCVQMLLKSGCDPNMSDKNGMTALHVAAGQGHYGVVRRLLADGADSLRTDQSGQTPLHVASATVTAAGLQVVHLLLEHVQAKAGSAAAYVNSRYKVVQLKCARFPRLTLSSKEMPWARQPCTPSAVRPPSSSGEYRPARRGRPRPARTLTPTEISRWLSSRPAAT